MNELDFKSKAEKVFSLKKWEQDAEAFKYLSWSSFEPQDFEKAFSPYIEKSSLPAQKSRYRIVLVGGEFSKELSSLGGLEDKLTILTADEAKHFYSQLILSKEEKFLSKEDLSKFELWSAKEASCGLFLYVPPRSQIQEPIEILEIYPVSERSYAGLHRCVFGKHSYACFHHVVIDKGSSLISSYWDIHQEANSMVKWLLEDKGGVSPQFVSLSALLKKEATLKFYALDKGSSLLRRAFTFELLEERAEVEIKGLSLLKGKKQGHASVIMKHKAPECRSHQHFKTLVMDQARASFHGKIDVEACAQKTEAYQLSNQLLLSEKAQGFGRPQLEILADDVKASHGATVSRVSDEEIFYFRSRGVDKNRAQELLLKGFCEEILAEFSARSKEEFLKDL